MNQVDHADPVWFEGEKCEPGFEQLVCGLDTPANWRNADVYQNSKKADRFLPYRLVGEQKAPTEVGDVCLFLVGGAWVELGWLTPAWFAETTKTGRHHQARQGRQSAKRRDGAVGWRAKADPEALKATTEKQRQANRKNVDAGKRWGFMLPENRNCAAGGAVSGPKAATDKNKELRNLTKVLERDGVEVVCEPGELATWVRDRLLVLAPECAPLQPKDVHRVWAGGVAKGWRLKAAW